MHRVNFIVERIVYETEEACSVGEYPSLFFQRVPFYIPHQRVEPRQRGQVVEDRENLRGGRSITGKTSNRVNTYKPFPQVHLQDVCTLS